MYSKHEIKHPGNMDKNEFERHRAWSKDAKETWDRLSTYINRSGSTPMGIDYLFEEFKREHPTLQQNFFRLMAGFILRFRDLPDHYVDPRNEQSAKFCKRVGDLIEEEYLHTFPTI